MLLSSLSPVPFRPVPSLGVSPSAAVPLGTGTGQRPWLLAAPENPYYRPVSFNSIPLSEVSPFRGRRPSATSRRFPPALSVTLLYSPLHPGGSVQTIHDVNKCGVILHNGCACMPGLARPPSPAVLTTEPSSGTGGGPWVRDSFTQYHPKGLTRPGLFYGPAPHPSTLLAGVNNLLTSSTVGLCPPTRLLDASGPIPAPYSYVAFMTWEFGA